MLGPSFINPMIMEYRFKVLWLSLVLMVFLPSVCLAKVGGKTGSSRVNWELLNLIFVNNLEYFHFSRKKISEIFGAY